MADNDTFKPLFNPSDPALVISNSPEENFKISVGDNFFFIGYPKKPFNWIQRHFIQWLPGWKVENT